MIVISCPCMHPKFWYSILGQKGASATVADLACSGQKVTSYVFFDLQFFPSLDLALNKNDSVRKIASNFISSHSD